MQMPTLRCYWYEHRPVPTRAPASAGESAQLSCHKCRAAMARRDTYLHDDRNAALYGFLDEICHSRMKMRVRGLRRKSCGFCSSLSEARSCSQLQVCRDLNHLACAFERCIHFLMLLYGSRSSLASQATTLFSSNKRALRPRPDRCT